MANPLSGSILTSVKNVLAIDTSNTEFDVELAFHINAALFALSQLDIGVSGFAINGSTSTWVDFLGTGEEWQAVPLLVAMKVKLAFDPSGSQTVTQALKEIVAEHEYRLLISQ
jgi:hypothetical protein